MVVYCYYIIPSGLPILVSVFILLSSEVPIVYHPTIQFIMGINIADNTI